MAIELRITFKESESGLYEYIKGKSSPSAFLKDLAAIEKKREDIYLNNNLNNIQETINAAQQSSIQPKSVEDLTLDDVVVDISDLERL